MNEKPLVSVLVTVYNRVPFLEECVNSILDSTYREIEVIICDDQSTDGSAELGAQLEKRESRVKFFQNPCNMGDYPNRNECASHASGTYLKYLDADDMVYPHSIEIMVAAMERFPEACLGLSVSVRRPKKPFPYLVRSEDAIRSYLYGRNILGVGPSSSIIRRDAFFELGGFSGERHISDSHLWFRLVKIAPLVLMQPSLVWWRIHGSQESARGRGRHEVLNRRYRLLKDAIEESVGILPDHELEYARQWVVYRHARRLLNGLHNGTGLTEGIEALRGSNLGFLDFARCFFPRPRSGKRAVPSLVDCEGV